MYDTYICEEVKRNIELRTEFSNKTECLDTGFYPVVSHLCWANLEDYILLK